ncbi:MAG: hypothetical protein EON58_20235, partial [Alphaproteobacteria bacterium]
MTDGSNPADGLGNGSTRCFDIFDALPVYNLRPSQKSELLRTADGFAELIAELRERRAPIGTEPRRLIQYVAEVLLGCVLDEAEGAGDVIPSEQQQQLETISDSLSPIMKKLAELGRLLDPAQLGDEGVPTDLHPWLGKVDHVAAAAMPFVCGATASSQEQAARHLAG